MARTSAYVMFDRDPASKAAGIELIDAVDGQATVRMRVTGDTANGPGDTANGHATTRGGYVFMLAGKGMPEEGTA